MKQVYVCLQNNVERKIPKFSQCLVDYFAKNALQTDVACSLNDKWFTLTAAKHSSLKFQHSPGCPFHILNEEDGEEYNKMLDDVSESTRQKRIPVAVSILVESSDGFVLLTRRAAHMRSSPGVWVPPGGHLEVGETLIECGHREVQEETGIDLSNTSTQVLGLWENSYPLLLGFGNPKSHTLVVYCHAKLTETHTQVLQKITANPEEVEAYTWISPSILNYLFNGTQENNLVSTQYKLQPDGSFQPQELDLSKMFNRALWTSGKSFSGVQYVLRTWQSMKQSPSKY